MRYEGMQYIDISERYKDKNLNEENFEITEEDENS